MRKICMFMFLAVATLMLSSAQADHHKRYGYFYLTQGVEIDNSDAVPWVAGQSVVGNDEDSFTVSSIDNTKIIIEHPGIYSVNYSLTLASESEFAEFGLFTENGGQLVDGSVYAIDDAFINNEPQLNGQVIFAATHKNSTLQLVNLDTDVVLISDAGTENTNVWGPNVCASILIEKLADL